MAPRSHRTRQLVPRREINEVCTQQVNVSATRTPLYRLHHMDSPIGDVKLTTYVRARVSLAQGFICKTPLHSRMDADSIPRYHALLLHLVLSLALTHLR